MLRKSTFSLILTIIFISFASSLLHAQVVNIDNALLEKRSNFNITSQRLHIGPDASGNNIISQSATEAVTSFPVDYDTLSTNDAAFFWFLNKNFTGAGDMTYALVTFDSLAELGNATGYDYDAHTVLIDTISFVVSHVNASGMDNVVTVSILALDSADYFTNTVLWETSVTTATSLTGAVNQFATLVVTPDFAMCAGKYAVRIDFDGPTTDTLGVIAGFQRNVCASTMCVTGGPGAAAVSPFYPNSYYGYNNGPANPLDIPTAAGGDLYRDCSGDMMFTAGGCEAWYVQNFWIFSDISITDQPIAPLGVTSTSTPDDGTNNGMATVAVTGGLGAYSIRWTTTPEQLGDTATNLPAGTYNAIITYGSGCETLVEGVTVGSTVSIDDKLSAGIDRLDIFPNPSSGVFTLALELETAQDLGIEVVNLHGQQVFAAQDKGVRTYRKSINLGQMAAGIYILSVKTNKGTAYRQIVVE